MNCDEIIKAVNQSLLAKTNRGLSNAERFLLEKSLQGKTYEEMASESNNAYSFAYLGQDVGPDLWKKISKALKVEVNKKNCLTLRDIILAQHQKQELIKSLPSFVEVPSPQESADSTLSSTTDSNKNTEFYSVLEKIGIIGGTSGIKESESIYAPRQCMKRVKTTLDFLGILGSKWVNEVKSRNEMKIFLSRISTDKGSVRFLLINPWSKEFETLKIKRGSGINIESLNHFQELMNEFDCLKVRLYRQLPCFRLIFIDYSILALARYRIDREGYFKSNFGWEVPHLVIEPSAKYSLYFAFEEYYRQVWESSLPLEEVNLNA